MGRGSSTKFCPNGPQRGGAARRKVKEGKGIGAERNYFLAREEWTSLVHFKASIDALIPVPSPLTVGRQRLSDVCPLADLDDLFYEACCFRALDIRAVTGPFTQSFE